MGTSHIAAHTFRGIAMAETIRALRNTDSETKFRRLQRQLIHRFKRRAYPLAAIRAIRSLDFSQRAHFLETTNARRIERPLPFNTLFYRFASPLNTLFRRAWEGLQGDYRLWTALPTHPFLTCKNHPTVGQTLSHKRRDFGSSPTQRNLLPENAIQFHHQRFNRPRRKGDLSKSNPTSILRRSDRTCGNVRCQVCPVLTSYNFVASTSNSRTYPIDPSLRCMTTGVIYLLTCRRCQKQYVGQTAKTMRERLARHRVKFRTAPMSVYSHFRRYHHLDVLDVSVTLLARETDENLRTEREKQWIQRLETTIPKGLNNPPTG